MEQAEIFEPEAYEKIRSSIQPIYSLTEGVHQKMIGKLVRQVLDEGQLFEDYLPEELRMEFHLAEYNYAPVSYTHLRRSHSFFEIADHGFY